MLEGLDFDNCEKLSTIANGAFYNCIMLRSLSLPEKLTGIGSSAFYGCARLNEVSIPQGVTSIGAYAFLRLAVVYEHTDDYMIAVTVFCLNARVNDGLDFRKE